MGHYRGRDNRRLRRARRKRNEAAIKRRQLGPSVVASAKTFYDRLVLLETTIAAQSKRNAHWT